MKYLELLLKGFLDNEELIEKIYIENELVIDYFIKSNENINNLWELISDFIKEELLYTFANSEILFGSNYLDLYLKSINSFWLEDYVSWIVDIYNEDLIYSYTYFEDFAWIEEWDENLIKVMIRAQYNWYYCLFSMIIDEFINYIEDKNI